MDLICCDQCGNWTIAKDDNFKKRDMENNPDFQDVYMVCPSCSGETMIGFCRKDAESDDNTGF